VVPINFDIKQDVAKTAKLNMGVLHFLAECGIPPSVIDSPAFKEMMKIQAQVGSSAKIGTAKQFSKGRDTQFGLYLETGLREAREIKNCFFRKAEQCGHAVCLLSDVAKSIKRSTNSTIAQAAENGCIHIKHTDPGSEKK